MSRDTRRIAELSPEQKRALLAKLVREKGRAADPVERPVHRMFEAHARKTPEAVAVGAGEGTLSYAELNARSNRLAHHLRALGVGPGVTVGLCVERGPGMVVGLLGVLKAGGAYLPLDPGFPASRLAFMMADAAAPVLVTESALRDRVGGHEAYVVALDDQADAIAARPDGDPEGGATADDLAYVIYTSGSTGTPKGVMVPHRALSNFLLSMARQPGLTARDVLLAVTTLSFDIAALELFLPLVVGARVEVAGRDEAADGARLAARIKASGASVLQATPATWRLLLESGWEGDPGLTALCGGEALTRDLADRLLGKARAVWNLYGPTETTVWSTLAAVEPGAGPVPIGRPVANTRAYVLDARLRPSPVGVSGELYLGGLGLARGYHGRPALTAERFVADPYAKAPGARMYRTGDLARFRADGVLECLGRVDGQVKIRGYRVELGEVEAALAAHPAVSAAAAAARDEATGEKRLVGYLVPRGAGPGEAELRAWLRERLPEHMVPSAFVALEALPLTPNGKVDRKALPDPEPDRPGLSAPSAPARGPLEEALAAVWAEVLGRAAVGAHDDFFESGGHSLLAAQVLARVRETFAVDLPLKALFDAPTVAGLARQVEAALREGAGLSFPPLGPVARDGPVPASFAQQRLWFLDQLDPGSPTYNMPATVRLKGALDADALRRALGELARRHESLRTTFDSEGGLPVQVIAPELEIDLPVDDLSDLPEAEREAEALRRAAGEAWWPFDLAAGPLFRARLFRLGPEEHLVTVVTHHTVSDGWSIGVLILEAGRLYDAFARGEPSPLPPLPVQYADYAVWQREWLRGDVLEAHLAYWREALAGVPPLELPTDRPRPAAPSGRGGQRAKDWPRPLADSLRALGKSEGATLFMALLTGFEAVLARHSGQADFAVGTPVAGRPTLQTEGLIGFFTNTLALRADLSGDPSFRALLRRVKPSALAAFAHQDVPFDLVVNALHPDRDPSRAPLFQVMLVLQNAPLPALEAPGLSMTPLEVESVTAKFDLTLTVTESPGGLRALLEYNADLFDPATADRLLGHLETLLGAAVAEPDAPVSALAMLTEEEQRMLLGWTQSGAVEGDEPPTDAEAAEALAGLEGLSDEELDALINRT
jgi:amino acid adenylation domain-containing protein